MTDEMLAVADAIRARLGVLNATFVRGAIDAVPLPNACVDVVISNCVINLARDKGSVLQEALRVLLPGGRLVVADMVEVEPLPAPLKGQVDAWAGCVAGTIPVVHYQRLLRDTGFTRIHISIERTFRLADIGLTGPGAIGSALIRAERPVA